MEFSSSLFAAHMTYQLDIDLVVIVGYPIPFFLQLMLAGPRNITGSECLNKRIFEVDSFTKKGFSGQWHIETDWPLSVWVLPNVSSLLTKQSTGLNTRRSQPSHWSRTIQLILSGVSSRTALTAQFNREPIVIWSACPKKTAFQRASPVLYIVRGSFGKRG